MKIIAVVLLIVGAVLGFVVPSFYGDLYSVGGEIGFKSGPRTVRCSLRAVLRMAGIVLMALSILFFVIYRHTAEGEAEGPLGSSQHLTIAFQFPAVRATTWPPFAVAFP